MPSSAVIFDLDGTLVDTPAAIGQLLTEVLAEAGCRPPYQDVAATIGRPLGPSMARLLGVAETDPVTLRTVERYSLLFDERVLSRGPGLLHPGVPDGLARLASAGLGCALATSKNERVTRALLDATGIAGYFPVVVTHDMVTRGKPDPEMALRAAAELAIEPAACTYVGDAEADMEMARAAGMGAVGVGYGVGTAESLRRAGASAVWDDYPALVRGLLEVPPRAAR